MVKNERNLKLKVQVKAKLKDYESMTIQLKASRNFPIIEV
jgi:hypothetical protein